MSLGRHTLYNSTSPPPPPPLPPPQPPPPPPSAGHSLTTDSYDNIKGGGRRKGSGTLYTLRPIAHC